jgi:hypothetical protein
MALVAHSSDLSLFDLIQVKGIARATCHIAVSGRGVQGVLVMRDGMLTFAACGDLRGEEAAYAILQQPEVSYRLTSEVLSLTSNMQVDHQVLLLEAVRRIDEQVAVAARRAPVKVESPTYEYGTTHLLA